MRTKKDAATWNHATVPPSGALSGFGWGAGGSRVGRDTDLASTEKSESGRL